MPIYKLSSNTPAIDHSAFISPNATIIGKAEINADASIWFNTVIRADMEKIVIGKESNIQDLTMCHADIGFPLIIGDRVTVGHNCIIHGCTIEEDCLIGMGVTIMNGAVIKKGSLIAAGSVILENTVIPENSLVTGVPGKVKKELPKGMLSIIQASAEVYKNKSKDYANPELFTLIS